MGQNLIEMGIDPDQTATHLEPREAMLACGIRPESNEFSRGIAEAREEELN